LVYRHTPGPRPGAGRQHRRSAGQARPVGGNL